MGKMRKTALIVVLGAALAGCHGAKAPVPIEFTAPPDTTGAFVFAESPVLNVTGAMMAEQFNVDMLPAATKKIDSLTAENTVYEILMDSLLGKESDTFDLRTNHTLYRQYEQLRYDQIMRLLYKRLIADSVVINDSEIAMVYRANQDAYRIPDKYRVRHIVVSAAGLKKSPDSVLYRGQSNETLDSIAHEMIVKLRQRIVAGEPFDTMAMLYSQDPGSASQGGELGFMSLASLVKPFDSAVEHTPIGELSPPVKTVFGWHILKVEEFAPAHVLPLDSVRADIVNKIFQEKITVRSRTFVDSLRAKATVEFDSAALAMPDSLHKPTDLMAVANPQDTEYGCDTLRFEDYVEQVYPYQRSKKINRPLEYDEKVELLTGIAMRGHLMRAARRLGYDKDPEILAWCAQTHRRYAISIMKKAIIDENHVVPDSEVRAYYDSHIKQYQVERPLTVQHIIFADSALAEYVRDLLNSGADFMEMAEKYYPGEPDIRTAAADLGQIGPRDMPPAFYSVAMSTPVGSVSRPVKTEFGYHLIKVLSRNVSIDYDRAALTIRPMLKKAWQEQTRRDYVDWKLGRPPKIRWERWGDLYRKIERPPADYQGPR
jgi:parvulin-like peptidyl-prolyl isomerase